MIEAAMYAALGFLVATFLGLMIVPAIGRRADRLARRRAEAAFPLSLDQVAAERDHLRGELAVRERAMERKMERGLSLKGQALEDVGRRDGLIVELRSGLAEREQAIASLTSNLPEMTRERDMTHERLDAESSSLAGARHERDASLAHAQSLGLELDQTRQQFEVTRHELAQTSEKLDSSRVRLADAEIRLSDLSQRNSALTQALEDVRTERNQLQKDVAQAQDVQAEWHAKHDAVQQMLIASKSEVAQKTAELEDANERQDALEGRFKELEAAFMARGQDLTEARSSLKALAAEHDDVRRKMRESEAEKTRVERERIAHERAQTRHATEQKREFDRMTESLGLATQAAVTAKNDRDEVQAALTQMRGDRAQLMQEVKAAQRDAARLESDIRAENSALRAEIAKVADAIMTQFSAGTPKQSALPKDRH